MRLGQFVGLSKYAFPPEFSSILKKLNEGHNYE